MTQILLRIIFCVVGLLLFVNFSFAAGESDLNLSPNLNLNPLDVVSSIGIGGFDAFDTEDIFKGFQLKFTSSVKNLNIDTNIPISPKSNTSVPGPSDIDLKQFLTPKDVSSDDLGEAIKAVITLVIEIFLVVISIISQILRLVLGFLR